MSVRIGSAMMYQMGLAGILNRQNELARAQEQLTTGLRITRAADDPAGAEAGEALDATKRQLEQYATSSANLRHRLNLEDAALGGMNNALARVRELVLSANTALQTADTRAAIAVELRQTLGQMVAIANTDDGTGRYLFAGTQDATPPFSLAAGTVSYGGDQVQRDVDVGFAVAIADADPGSAAFMTVRNGNGTFTARTASGNTGNGVLAGTALVDISQWDGGDYRIVFNGGNYDVLDAGNAVVASGPYVAGNAIEFRGARVTITGTPATGDTFTVSPARNQDIFATVRDAIAAVEAPTGTPAQQAAQQNAYFSALEDLARAESHVADTRGGVGSRLVSLDVADDGRGGALLEMKTVLSQLRDVDYAEVASRMQMSLTALDAAQAAFIKINSSTLFERLR